MECQLKSGQNKQHTSQRGSLDATTPLSVRKLRYFLRAPYTAGSSAHYAGKCRSS